MIRKGCCGFIKAPESRALTVQVFSPPFVQNVEAVNVTLMQRLFPAGTLTTALAPGIAATFVDPMTVDPTLVFTMLLIRLPHAVVIGAAAATSASTNCATIAAA